MNHTYKIVAPVLLAGLGASLSSCTDKTPERPNVVFVFVDEWRAQDIGYNGNTDVITPNIDRLATESVNLYNTISGCPVCTPYRGSLLTGQYPLTNGVFMNDVLLDPEAESLPKVYKAAGYETAYIGKWHLDGHGRNSFIPKERRQGFDYWKVLECTHNYNDSWYWDNNDEFKKWDGYDAYAQTEDAINYINDRKDSEQPFLLVISYGPPHTPFQQAPEDMKQLYRDKDLRIRPNVPEERKEEVRHHLTGYYGHITALDRCIGDLQQTIKDAGMEDNTIFVFTSDHGYMIHSQGWFHKQVPYEESIHVPFLLKYPRMFGWEGQENGVLVNTPDIMPTLLGLSNLPIPKPVEGRDLTGILTGKEPDDIEAVLIACYQPFGQWPRRDGGVEYRGVRTKQYTYAHKLDGPWLLFDNVNDPYQMNNLIHHHNYTELRESLHAKMQSLLKKTNDSFVPGMNYIERWNYVVDATETIPYQRINFRGEPIVPPR